MSISTPTIVVTPDSLAVQQSVAPGWLWPFREGSALDRDLLGGKGANLAELTRLGCPVPPGFTLVTDACRAWHTNGGHWPEGAWVEIPAAVAEIERATGRAFGDPDRPLLLSVRSGAPVSMPGMMDTILNVGVTNATLPGLAQRHGWRFALDCRRRLLQMFGRTVFGIDAAPFDSALERAKSDAGVARDDELDERALRNLTARYEAILADHGERVPEEPLDQLRLAMEAVIRSWQSPRAVAYRQAHDIADAMGTAVTVQAMVFGNGGPDSATGVAFSRDPNTGAPGLFGEYLVNAQGEDVVAGIRTPQPIAEMANDPLLASASREFIRLAGMLECHFGDLQDMEFTIEHGRLWLLQTRTGKRSARAAVRIALDMVEEGLIDYATAVRRIEPIHIDGLMHPQVAPNHGFVVLATGLAASPGAASGEVVFDPAEARRRGERGEAVILVRNETAAEDFPGMEHAQGILTARGGMTSHAAVVARGMGKPAVTGCAAIEIDETSGCIRAGGATVRAGEVITIDGSSGQVIHGRASVTIPEPGGEMATILGWADAARRLGVRANADTPADAARAREHGAEGIGLCRTEHMFFAADRIDRMRAMILAETPDARVAALSDLEEMQVADFTGIFRAMDGLPVTIRTLDPPLHEFLPCTDEDIDRLAALLEMSPANLRRRIDDHREVNPMLGHRGCRLGITAPDVTAMQARALFRAAIACAAEGLHAEPEVMIPLVADAEEARRQRDVIEAAAEGVFAAAGHRLPVRVGAMIELPRAALLADRIAEHADFISFGTNDLTQMTYGLSRDDAGRFLPDYLRLGVLPGDPFRTLDRDGVGQLVAIGVERARRARPGIKVGICGEHGGDPASIAFCHDLGLDYVSCSPYRIPVARLAAAHAAIDQAGMK